MDLSAQFPGSRVAISPQRNLLASASKDRLVIRTADSLQVLHSIKVSDATSSLEFSPDAGHLLVCSSNGTTTVFNCDSAAVLVTIPPPIPTGIISASWLSQRLIGIWSKELGTLNVHNLEGGSLPIRLRPKHHAPAGYTFNPVNKQLMALIERTDGQDMLALYDLAAEDCRLARLIRLPTTDAVDLCWSPCGSYIAIWESIFDDSIFVVTPDGRPMCQYRVSGNTELGIRTVAWDPLMRFLVIGDYSSQIHLIATLTWTRLLVFSLAPQPASTSKKVWLHSPPSHEWDALKRNLLPYTTSQVPTSSVLSNTNCKKPDPAKAPVRTGIVQLAASTSSPDLMVARDESWPNHVFLFSLDETQRDLKTVIRLDEPVKELAWRPEQGVDSQVLSMTSSLASMTFWFGDGSEGGRTELMQSGDQEFQIRGAQWNNRGDALVLSDVHKFMVGRPVLGPED